MDGAPTDRPKIPFLDVTSSWSSLAGDPSLTSKLVIGSALYLSFFLLLPIVFSGPVLLGYAILTTRNAMAGDEHPLPEWTGWGEMWVLGLWMIIATLAYMLPFMLGVGVVGVLVGVGIAFEKSGGEVLAVVGVVLYYMLILTGSLVGLVMRFTLFPVAHIQLARYGSLGSVFAFREMWRLFRGNPWNILVTALLQYAGSVLVSVGFCLCIVPSGPIYFLVQTFTGVNLGTAERLRMAAHGELTAPGS